jgi:hypothetical protein
MFLSIFGWNKNTHQTLFGIKMDNRLRIKKDWSSSVRIHSVLGFGTQDRIRLTLPLEIPSDSKHLGTSLCSTQCWIWIPHTVFLLSSYLEFSICFLVFGSPLFVLGRIAKFRQPTRITCYRGCRWTTSSTHLLELQHFVSYHKLRVIHIPTNVLNMCLGNKK